MGLGMKLVQDIEALTRASWLLNVYNISFSAVPSQPRSFVVSTISGSPRSLSISWLLPEIQNGIIVSYTVYCMEAPESDTISSGIGMGSGDSASKSDMLAPDNSTVRIVVVPGNETEVIFPDLVPYTVYSCYASASTSAGEGNFTAQLTARTDESGKEKRKKDFEAQITIILMFEPGVDKYM